MLNTYGLLKMVHVLSAIVWIGGVAALWGVGLRLGKAGRRDALAALLPLATRYGQRIAGPASLLVLVSGIAMVMVGHLGSPLWVRLGFIGILIHFVFGATLIRRNWTELGRLTTGASPDDARLAMMLRRTALTNWVYLLLMISVVAIMVLKPTA